MTRSFTRTLLAPAALLAATALALTGCGQSSAEPAASSAPEVADTPLKTVDPAGHEVSLDHQPTAALGFYTTDVDILTTLRVPLAKEQPIRGDSGFTTFPDYFDQDALAGVTPFANYPEFNYERVLGAAPDFILSGLGYDAEIHEKLAAIAPTYTTNAFDGETWQSHFEQTAKDLGRQAQYDTWLQEYQQAGTEAKAAIDEAGNGDLTVATLGYWDGKVNVDCYAYLECGVFDTIGLKTTDLSREKGLTLTLEELDKLKDVDVVWMSTGVGEDAKAELDKSIAAMAKSPYWKDLPFVKNEKIYTYNMEMAYGSPSGAEAFLAQVRSDLAG
ncbi:ABC transporter substrate-binding protein [Glutamicibacter sp. NPDC087344]|uniref:ABC transporter substrate-binding protein n=1 Tax=Glutamicibacter sp. NPDC087344 TaxID=3363994 RepID=UPI003815F10A